MQGPQQTVLLTYTYTVYRSLLAGGCCMQGPQQTVLLTYTYTVYRSLLAGGCCMQGPQQTVLLTYILYIGACWQVAVVCRDHSRQYCLRIYCI